MYFVAPQEVRPGAGFAGLQQRAAGLGNSARPQVEAAEVRKRMVVGPWGEQGCLTGACGAGTEPGVEPDR